MIAATFQGTTTLLEFLKLTTSNAQDEAAKFDGYEIWGEPTNAHGLEKRALDSSALSPTRLRD
jgi:hypothetical protein